MSNLLHITVAYSPAPRQMHEVEVALPMGGTVQDALTASGLLARFPDMKVESGYVGVWGRKVPLGQLLRERDRVEVWRPLRVDPKLARRERFVQQGARAAGLFAQRRPGAKPGY
ncbi:MAG: RnfH family protein [Pseudomonadota bacterium]|nr:RnfH family protein [Pseudomonadota bacterium]